jgi:hypothetical protein
VARLDTARLNPVGEPAQRCDGQPTDRLAALSRRSLGRSRASGQRALLGRVIGNDYCEWVEHRMVLRIRCRTRWAGAGSGCRSQAAQDRASLRSDDGLSPNPDEH